MTFATSTAGQRCQVMGILNVTSDSFSDGGRYLDRGAAIAHGVELRRAGADVVDVGGESTRPGAQRVDAAAETERVVPVVAALCAEGVPVSVDTMRASVAAAAVAAGATIINDVSGGKADPDMARVVAETGATWVLMHWRAHSDTMAQLATYDDVVADVRTELMARVEEAVRAGVDPSRLVIDPGLGFAKTGDHNWALLRALPDLVATGLPVLVGASRKRFLGALLADADGTPRPAAGREVATAVLSALAATHGAWGVRVHDVLASVDAVAVAGAWQRGSATA
ncbi:dihydropteroate synthase [Rhodococcus sp. X156]|uniref:dihydropteroate synthase n=1 Tax=Rhodococcus sp. X156 TaxID=2499145 RepID=UPI0019D06824|nr:dihydropteroate synthase [Rhodococcus sp. X156]